MPREKEIVGRDRARRHSTPMELADRPDLAPARDRERRSDLLSMPRERDHRKGQGTASLDAYGARRSARSWARDRERRSDLLSTSRERERLPEGTGHGVTRRLWSSPIGLI